MRKRFIPSLLPAAILLTVGLVSGLWSGDTASADASESIAASTLKVGRSRCVGAPGDEETPTLARLITEVRAMRHLTPTLSEDGTAMLAEMSELQLMSQGTNLGLTSVQWSALAAAALNIQAIRQTYEAAIATSAVLAPGRFRVEIPMYANIGDAIRTRFLAELRTELGETTTREIVEKLGARLEGHFAGFGVGVQTLEITANPGGARSDCEVTRTVTYWNSVEGSERLTTHRETHFPRWEDPTGESWGPLLAIVGA